MATLRLALPAAVSAIAVATGLALGCNGAPPPPQEKWRVVASATAPLFRKLKDGAAPHDLIRAGELVKVVRELRSLHWSGKMEGVEAARDGLALEVKYAEDGMVLSLFQQDLGAELSVPTTSHLCEEIAGQGSFHMARCPALLRRARTADGALLLYMTCNEGPCPVGLLKDGKLSVIAVENLTSAQFFTGKKKSLLLAATRWTKDEGKQSGGALVPIVLDGPTPARKDEIAVDQIDSRNPDKMLARLVTARVTAAEITLGGEETVAAADGTLASKKPIQEKHPLPPLD